MEDSGAFSPADLETFFDISQVLLCVIDLKGTLLRLSGSWRAVLGWDVEAMIGQPVRKNLHPDDALVTVARLSSRAAGDNSGDPIINRYRHADGSYRWLRWDTRTAADGREIWCVAHDITEQRTRAEQQAVVADLGRQALEGGTLQELLETSVEALSQGLSLPIVVVMELLPDQHLVARTAKGVPFNPEAPTLLPVDRLTVSGRALLSGRALTIEDVLAEDEHHQIQQDYGAHGALAVPVGRADRPWGVLAGADTRPRIFDDAEVRFLEQVAHVVGAAIARREAEQGLQHQATHDSLTGLPNRELLRERMNQALHERGGAGRAMGLLLCDLDGFKDVNDSLGHAAGDTVLQQLAQRLLATVGPDDTVARLGGDEFAICVVGPATELEVLGMADSVVRAMRQPFSLPELDVPLSTSIGVVVSPTHGRDASTLLRHADVAMYRAKAGSLGWALYDASVDGASTDRLVMTADLRGAIATDSLRLDYQPVVDLETGRLHSIEALCRWDHHDRGSVEPTTFISLAEQTGVVLPLTTWVVRHALTQVHDWRAAGHDVTCAVNLSMAAVADEEASEPLIHDLIRAAGLLTVEITESWLVDSRGREVIAELAAGGVRLSLDDFGTGFSSLASLRAFPVQQVKLDQHFVLDLDHDRRGDGVLRAVAQLADALDIDVVAEGVEEQQTADRLLGAGLRLGQGFLWSRPVPAAALEPWLEGRAGGLLAEG
jgi:diguanylate cyclase (GGDEF)-like protein/PAS domain S-box-containing protein